MPSSSAYNPAGLTIEAIEAAAGRLTGVAAETPLVEAELLNRQAGRRILVKAECLQRTGSFKFRGAFNAISQLTDLQKKNGVVAFSSGNHAQGVAAAAALFGIPATIVMPADAPALKIANTRAYGAEVILYDRQTESREAIGAGIARRTGAHLIKPYDDYSVMAGQGTVGLEIARQVAALGLIPDGVLVPCGGGGLIAGVATALAARMPGVPVYAVEPTGFDDTGRSLVAGQRMENAPGAETLADALMAPQPGELTFAINKQRLAGGLAVDDGAMCNAVAQAARLLKLVIEPGGAVALAAALAKDAPQDWKIVVAVASGGNLDPALLSAILAEKRPPE